MKAPIFVTSVVMILTVFPHFLILWHSDSEAIVRHGLFVAVQFQLAYLILTILLVDAFFTKQGQQKSVLF